MFGYLKFYRELGGTHFNQFKKNYCYLCRSLDKKYGLYVVETNFVGNGKLGYYEAELSNRYFCHVLLSDDGLGGITQEKLVSVSKNDNILSKSDILNKSNVLRLVRGE